MGAKGASEAQARSLQALLDDHGLVKVKINMDAPAAADAAERLASGANAVLLQQKGMTGWALVKSPNIVFDPGNTLLFAPAAATSQQLQDVAATNLEKKQKQQVYKQRKHTGMWRMAPMKHAETPFQTRIRCWTRACKTG